MGAQRLERRRAVACRVGLREGQDVGQVGEQNLRARLGQCNTQQACV